MKADKPSCGIGVLSRRTGVNIETIRYYERTGLLPNPPRSAGGHRIYNKDHLQRLIFVRRCRQLGFSMDEIQNLLALVDSESFTCGQVQRLTMAHTKNIQSKIADLKQMEKTLLIVLANCKGGDVPECPIIESLMK